VNNQSDCWEKAYELIIEGKSSEVMQLCQKLPCAEDSVDCQIHLGWCFYESGNLDKGLYWFNKAVDKKDSEAMYGIGCIHFVKREFEIALGDYHTSLQWGYRRSAYWLGLMYEHGLGTAKNIQEAKRYYELGYTYGYLIAKRAAINLIFKNGNLFQKLLIIPSFIYLVFHGLIIAKNDIKDERLADIPNAFKSKGM
jgi:TPR repeat protein